MMKNIYLMAMIFLEVVTSAVSLNAQTSSRVNNLREVVVWSNRPMKEIGVQTTTFDSLALKENIALSMADILTFNSSVFVKSYGRATLSTVAFRGTSPSHTQVTWNGMRINNPMLGMTDFSTIPSYFIDQASLLHGTSSVNETGGGLGGLVKLGTTPYVTEGFNMQYVQGIGSFSTFDEFARITYGNGHWASSTRFVYSSSPNDYKYINHDKKVNIYDDEKNIIGQYHPTERNKSGAFRDMHILQEVYYNTNKGDRLGLNAWYINSNRELPMLTTDYGDERDFENRQREQTFRGVLSWDHNHSGWKIGVKGGYIHTLMAYDYKREVAGGNWAVMTRSRSRVNTFFGQVQGSYIPNKKWYFTTNISTHQHFVRSEDKNIILQDGDRAIVGYDKGRIEMSGSVSAKWQPIDPIGMSIVVREDMFGEKWAPLIPAFFVDGLISRQGNLMVKASVSKNHKFPTLNDLYFLPGGNPDLKSENGWTYDAGASFDVGNLIPFPFSVGGSVTWFDSYIDDWIMWLPTTKGFFSPRNVKKVHAYGIEAKLNIAFESLNGWGVDINSSYSWTPSINDGEKMSPADQSVGKQLPYVPKHSASFTGRLSWKRWCFLYKWAYYSERFTMSSNDYTLTGHLPRYFMSNISLEKGLSFKPVDLQLKLAVNNLFNEDYLSVLSRPMPGINFEVFIGITPKF
ncbi:MAG: TonB-dependent receptor [Clostridiales bacterium]|nr:TonB-dependent receptor [Clostridiales bacterium]